MHGEALWGFKLFKSVLTPGVKISIWDIEGKQLGHLSGMDPMGY